MLVWYFFYKKTKKTLKIKRKKKKIDRLVRRLKKYYSKPKIGEGTFKKRLPKKQVSNTVFLLKNESKKLFLETNKNVGKKGFDSFFVIKKSINKILYISI